MPEFFDFIDDPTPEEQSVVLVKATTLRKAEKLIESCEYCILQARRFRSTTFLIV